MLHTFGFLHGFRFLQILSVRCTFGFSYGLHFFINNCGAPHLMFYPDSHARMEKRQSRDNIYRMGCK